MTKGQVALKLSGWFEKVHILEWLKTFPDNHVFNAKTYFQEYVDWQNKLPKINKHEDE